MDINQVIQCLKTNHIPDDAITLGINKNMIKIKEYKKNNIIHYNGEDCTSLEFLVKGSLKIAHINSEGDDKPLNHIKKNGIIGGNIIFGDNPKYPLSVCSGSDVVIAQINRVGR